VNNNRHHNVDHNVDHDHDQDQDNDELLEERGRGLGLRLLALLGALSFLMLGISSIAPLLQPSSPPQLPDQRRAPVSFHH
jgi:hypothetical protein